MDLFQIKDINNTIFGFLELNDSKKLLLVNKLLKKDFENKYNSFKYLEYINGFYLDDDIIEKITRDLYNNFNIFFPCIISNIFTRHYKYNILELIKKMKIYDDKNHTNLRYKTYTLIIHTKYNNIIIENDKTIRRRNLHLITNTETSSIIKKNTQTILKEMVTVKKRYIQERNMSDDIPDILDMITTKQARLIDLYYNYIFS